MEYLGYTINISFSNSPQAAAPSHWTFSVSENGTGKIGDSGDEQYPTEDDALRAARKRVDYYIVSKK